MEDHESLLEGILDGDLPTDLPFALLQKITNNFSEERKIGQGGFGAVYKGVLGKRIVAVKKIYVNLEKIDIDDKLYDREFKNLWKISHENVVRFLGLCSNTCKKPIEKDGSMFLADVRERLFCFEYISGGSLDLHITDELRGLEWETRYKIITGICKGLCYLHEEEIVHMDLKPANILLDDGMVPKITDFGLSRSNTNSHTMAQPIGTLGYIAPEYRDYSQTTPACDIYSLGLIIIELLSGYKGEVPRENNVLRRWRHRWNNPPTLLQYQQVTRCIDIAGRCRKQEPKDRPSISEIISFLSKSESTDGKISPCFDEDDMLGIKLPELELRLPSELKNEISRRVELINGTCNRIAFNIQVPSAQYKAEPVKGIVQPGFMCVVTITVQARDIRVHKSDADKFIVQSTKLGDGDITDRTFRAEAGKVVDEVDFMVVYEPTKPQENCKRRKDTNKPDEEVPEERQRKIVKSASEKGKNKLGSSKNAEAASMDINSSVQGQCNSRATPNQAEPLSSCSTPNWIGSDRITAAVNARPPSTTAIKCAQDSASEHKDLAEQMVGAAVSVVTGVMNPLIGKLTALAASDKYKKLKGVRRQASFLEKEFSAMKAALEKLELMDELDPAVRDWRDHVREMSYDMENCIDDFMRQFGRDDVEAGFIKRTVQRLKRLRQCHCMAARMEELKTLALEANERRERYNFDDWKPTSGSITVDPRLRAVYHEGANLVGIDGPTEELAAWLVDSKNKLKVLSIVGFGGLGKTTLAKRLYDKFSAQFHCEAFFSVSQKPDVKVLLNRLEAKLEIKHCSHAREIEDIIQDIKKHLKNKRYLIVVDDVWDQSVWNVISRAFPDEGNASRVIVTTRVEGVARTAYHNDHECIYRMKPLNQHNSRMLFFNRIFGSDDGCPSYLEDISADILKKCGGLPLAIITIASLLASQEGSRSGWENIKNSLVARSTINPTLDDVKNILNLSYMHLPIRLRACFLYLGMYPEDEEIGMYVVIREWVAEGLVRNMDGPDLMDVGKSYFNELINRSMLQPGRIEDGEVVSCRVHDIMLDLILSKCAEDNFLSVASSSEDITRLEGCKYEVRRLSLRSMDGGATNGLTIGASLLSQVRSCAWARNSIPPLVLFKYLRVLTLDCGYEVLTTDLTAINQLFQLRYLKVVAYRGRIELPCALKGLVYLETLDLNGDFKNSFPSDIVHLPRLSYLCLPHGAPAIQGVENMKSLHTLRWFNLDKNLVEDIRGLGELTNMRELELFSNDVAMSKIDALASSIGKLSNLKYLNIGRGVVRVESNQLDLLSSSPFKHIEILKLNDWEFPRVPKWMGNLHCLRVLVLLVMETSTEDVHALGKLPSLVWVYFSTRQIPTERAVLVKGVFPVVEEFRFLPSNGDVTAFLVFEEGAMPKLRTLKLKVNEWGGSTPVGIEHLVLLEKIRLEVYLDDKSSWTRDDVASAFRKATQLHPNRPSVSVW